MFTIDSSDTLTPAAIWLGGELTIYHATELYRGIKLLAETDTEWDVDVSQVTELDTAGVQVLLVCKRLSTRSGGDFRLVRHSKAVIEVLDAMNLASRFGDPIVMSSTH